MLKMKLGAEGREEVEGWRETKERTKGGGGETKGERANGRKEREGK